MRRRELFPTDYGLQGRMLAVAFLTPLFVVAAMVALVLTVKFTVLLGIAVVVVFGVAATIRARRDAGTARCLPPEQAPELHATVDRLCVLADLPKPDLVLEEQRQPNSWVIDLPGRPPRLHVTRGLLDALTPVELEAVLAHELSHVAHRDATVMSVVGLPGQVLLADGDNAWGWWPMMLGALLARTVGALSQIGTNALSRYRETAADAAAARITGHPAALASALLKVSGRLEVIPATDLRAAAANNAFNLLPVEIEAKGWGAQLLRTRLLRRLTRTHPSVEQRVAALDELERRMHGARPSPRLLD
jgi:heat shock protein HtpX